MTITEQLEKLRAWLEEGDYFSINEDRDYCISDGVEEGHIDFDTDSDSVNLTPDNVESVAWETVNEGTYGRGHYCHVTMKENGQGYEFRSFNISQRLAPHGEKCGCTYCS